MFENVFSKYMKLINKNETDFMMNEIDNSVITASALPPPSYSANYSSANNVTIKNAPISSNIFSSIGSSTYTVGSGGIGSGMFTMSTPAHIVKLQNSGQEIVRLNLDGSVEWANGIDVDAAAEAFGQSLHLAAEQRAGITNSVKLKMRDSVFEDLINIAKEKGSLTADDLTYLLEASKIVEKLKGGE